MELIRVCRQGEYVRVGGKLIRFGHNLRNWIDLEFIRKIDHPHEIDFHMLEVMYVNMVYKRGPPVSVAKPFLLTT